MATFHERLISAATPFAFTVAPRRAPRHFSREAVSLRSLHLSTAARARHGAPEISRQPFSAPVRQSMNRH